MLFAARIIKKILKLIFGSIFVFNTADFVILAIVKRKCS